MRIKKESIYIVIIPTVTFIITRCSGFDGLYGQDSYEYFRYANQLFDALKLNTDPGDYFWPLYYPLLGALSNFLINDMATSLGIISIVSLTVTAIYLNKTISILYSDTSNSIPFLLICFVISPCVQILGLVVMSDMLSLCFTSLSIYHALKLGNTLSTKHLYFTSIFAVCAIMTRYATVVVLFPFAILVSTIIFKNYKKKVHLIPIFIIIILLVVPHFYIKIDSPTGFLNHNWLKQWSFLNFFKDNFNTVDGKSSYTFANIIYSFYSIFHPRFLFFGLILLLPFASKKIIFRPNIYIFSGFILYSLFLAGIPFQNPRFLILHFGLALLLIFPSFQYYSTILTNKLIKKTSFGCIIVFQIILNVYFLTPYFKRNTLEQNIAKQMLPYQNNTLYSFDIDVSLKARSLEFEYKNLWSEFYTKFKEGGLLLFNPEKFKHQWDGKNPMLNWTLINNNHHLKKIETFNNGWVLFRIGKEYSFKNN